MRALFITTIVLFAAGCGVTLRTTSLPEPPDPRFHIREATSDRCVHGRADHGRPSHDSGPELADDPELARELEPFDPEVRRVARAAGVELLLARLLRDRHLTAAEGTDAHTTIALRQELLERVDSLETQLTAMEFEIDCVRSLVLEVLGTYEEDETDRQLVETIASLAVGAGTGLVAGFWDLANAHAETPFAEDAPIVISIAGAVAGTVLGAIVLVRRPREIVYLHERNVLTPIVAGEDPEGLYPSFVFRLLMAADEEGRSPRDALLEAYRELLDGAVGEDHRAIAEQIVLGGGGVYDPTLLLVHQEALELLAAALDALARDIDTLSSAALEVLEAPELDAP